VQGTTTVQKAKRHIVGIFDSSGNFPGSVPGFRFTCKRNGFGKCKLFGLYCFLKNQNISPLFS